MQAGGHTCEKPLAVGCGDLKGLRRQTSSETLYSFGSIDFRLMSSLYTAGDLLSWASAASANLVNLPICEHRCDICIPALL